MGSETLRARENSVDELIGNQVEGHAVLIGCGVLLNNLQRIKLSFIYTLNSLLA